MTVFLIIIYISIFLFAIFAAFLLTFYEWRSLNHRKKCRSLPSRKQNIIFGIGLEIALLKHEDLMEWMRVMWKELGDVIYFEVLGIPSVCLMNPQNIEAVFNNSQHITKGFEYASLVPWLCDGLLTSSGAKWHLHRKMLTPTFHFKILENYIPIFNKNAKLLTKKFAVSSVYSRNLDIDSYISLCTLDVICETAMGVSLDSQLGEAADYVAALRKAGEIVCTRTLTFWMRNEFLFKICPMGREFNETVKILHEFTEKVIQERKESFKVYNNQKNNKAENDENNGIYKQRKSFLDYLLELQQEHPSIMTDQVIREEVDTFMFEGQDTTAASLTWSFFMIATHPEVQENIRAELESIFGDSDRDATLHDLHQMQYIEKVIKESLRLYPSVPYVSRTLTCELHLEQYTVPANTNISIIPYLVHRNPSIYNEPDKFDPERFSPENTRERHPYSYIPFSAGYRNCIGQKFAMMESKVIISTVLRQLEAHTSLKKDDIKAIPHTILRPSTKLLLTFRPINTKTD